ncbi:MAG: hypothetical protein IJY01_01330 [Clostridia bacterium]|nr:hypothetical protein [Clostridia bacterium]
MSEKKEKKYLIDNPTLMAEWDWEKNNKLGLAPKTLTLGSNKKAWWKCSEGHEWQATIGDRNNGRGCPICSNQKVLKGYNDLATINPKLASEWNYEQNGELKPEDFTANSGKKVWWKCDIGHEWQATIASRNKGRACPYCVGLKVVKGVNDLATINPILASEWNYKRNGDLKPENFMAGSNHTVWWKCKKGHEWQATIVNRNKGRSCPICTSERNTSFPEYAIAYYLKKYNIEVLHTYKEKGYELDIYIPTLKIAIEYDGYFYHKSKTKKDLEKNSNCKKDGIKLYRIREGLPVLNDSSIDYFVDINQKNLAEVIQKVLSEIIGTNVDVDLKRDAIEIENLREYTEKENSLLYTNPYLAQEWNYEKNGSLRPEHILANSSKKVWWKCEKGHEWQAIIASRNTGGGCPICINRKILKGYNDLKTLNPQLASEWNYKNNGNLKPEDFASNSGKKVWWKCDKGHEWQATIDSRNNGVGCPYCAGQIVVKGVNDLATVNPKLAGEWNCEKNGDLKPEDFMVGSNKKVWWKCRKGHEWQSTVANRNNGNGCPYCSNKKILIGYNDLATIAPQLAVEWNYDRNIGLTPLDVGLNSRNKVWWKCDKGHEWQATIYSRKSGYGCPYCSGRNAIKGKNDLATLNPKLASEWNYKRNGDSKPEDFKVGSHQKVWWTCEQGHEWQATIKNRNKGTGCPYCSGHKKKKD